MANYRKVIDYFVDVGNSRLTDSDGSTAFLNPLELIYGANVLFRARLRYEDQTAFPIPEGTTFFYAIDDTFSASSHADYVVSSGDDFNQSSDWGEVSLSGGLICWRANFNTTTLKAQLAALTSKVMYEELWMQSPGTDYSLLFQRQVTVKNIVSDFLTEPTPPEGVTYASTDYVLATLAERFYVDPVTGNIWLKDKNGVPVLEIA